MMYPVSLLESACWTVYDRPIPHPDSKMIGQIEYIKDVGRKYLARSAAAGTPSERFTEYADAVTWLELKA